MKKISVTAAICIVTAVLCVLGMVSCGSKTAVERKARAVPSPLFRAFSTAAGRPYETGDEYESLKKLHDGENYKKSDVPNRRVTVFGNEYDLRYMLTQKTYRRGCGVDLFRKNVGDYTIYALFDEKTGIMVGCDYSPKIKSQGFISPISENSTEKDYLDLARSVILEYTGVDCGEWEYDVDTYIYHTTYKYSEYVWKSDFLNFIKEDPEFDAEFTFRFYKTLSGLHRGDDVRAVIRNDGTVLEVRGEVYDEAFAPFADVKIDAEELFRRVDGNYSAPGPEVYHRTRLTAIPAEDGLWVEASIKGIYYDEEGVPQWDDVTYAAKVAEYVD